MTNQEWVDGLPPVGCECNVMARPLTDPGCSDDSIDTVDDGLLIKVKYVDKDTVVGEYEDGRSYGFMVLVYNFRPLKTKEQTEREEAINNVCNDLGIMLGTSHDRIDAAIDSMLKLGYHNGPKMGEVVGVPQTRNLWRESDYNSYDVFIARNFTIIKKEEL